MLSERLSILGPTISVPGSVIDTSLFGIKLHQSSHSRMCQILVCSGWNLVTEYLHTTYVVPEYFVTK